MLSVAAFAESSDLYGCSGKISGTAENVNINAGYTDFDSHPKAANEHVGDGVISSGTTEGTIIGYSSIVAPGDLSMRENGRELAACAELDGDEFSVDFATGELDLEADEFLLKGYVWNTNLGFINLYCGVDGKDIVGEPCGVHPYGVTVGAAGESGGRILSGEAWNPVFGYVYFNILDDQTIGVDPCPINVNCVIHSSADEDEEKKVYRGPDGSLYGYAWTDAGVWISFEGANVSLDGSVGEISDDEWCDEAKTMKRPLCIEIPDPDPNSVEFSFENLEVGKIADGEEGYLIRLYLLDPDTDASLDIDDFQNFDLTFNWKDTVKKDQRSGSEGEFDQLENPWAGDEGGAIKSKPIHITQENFEDYFEDVVGERYYVLKEPIASYAPTSNMNTSPTTSTHPRYSVWNDVFFNEEVDPSPISNTLALTSATYTLVYDGVDYGKTVHLNGVVGFPFNFKPAVFIDNLYVNGFQDSIDAMRNIPIRFTLGLKTVGSLLMVMPTDFINLVLTPPAGGSDLCSGGFDFEFLKPDGEVDQGVVNKSFVDGESFPSNLSAIVSLSGVDCEQDCSIYDVKVVGEEDGDADAFDVCTEAKDTCTACSFAGNAGLHSVVHYQVMGAQGQTSTPSGHSEVFSDNELRDVYYYSNKLPRISSSITNPVAVIHGNIYAPKVFSPSAAQKTQATGNVSIDVVRNTVNENVKTYLSEAEDMVGSGETCTISEMKVVDGLQRHVVSSNCDVNTDFKAFVVEGENVLYFKNSDVVFDIPVPANWNDKWAVVVEGGEVFINDDLYREGVSGNLALVVMREEGGVCANSNIYIDKDVKNLQVNIAADCSIFSYDSTNKEDGIDDDGLPDWDSFENMIQNLDNQLFIEGSIASRNTIGGADLDADGKPYLLLGTGKTVGVTQDERYDAQLYDLNYLRLFKLKLDITPEGLPVDQSCEKALTVQDMIAINEKNALMAAALSSIEVNNILGNFDLGAWYYDEPCDGINPLNKYSDDDGLCFGEDDFTSCSGDLTVLVEDKSKLAEGLPLESYEPVYVHYKPSTSFVFKKTSRTTTY